MYPVHLYTIADAASTQNQELLVHYLRYKQIRLRPVEVTHVASLLQQLQQFSLEARDVRDVYVGFQIEQIGKEFDLLRISEEHVVNIELKSIHTGDKMRQQLLKNRYYLTFLKRPVYYFTYVYEEGLCYELQGEELVVVEPSRIVSLLQQQLDIYRGDVHALFDVSNYLISPLYHPDAFLAGQYFLNSQQSQFKAKILAVLTGNEQCVALTGAAGTGKTLLLYDIVRTLQQQQQRVVMIHSAPLHEGHAYLNASGFFIFHIAAWRQYIKAHPQWHIDVDVMVVDEAQRLDADVVDHMLALFQQAELSSIFSYDPEQQLFAPQEYAAITQQLAEHVTASYELTTKLRAHKELTAFIQNFFDTGKRAVLPSFSRITVEFFTTDEALAAYIDTLAPQWHIFSAATHFQYDIVTSQEFDDVVVIVDERFFYERGQLRVTGADEAAVRQLLYRQLTRARKRITLIIVRNEAVLTQALAILHV